MEGPEKSGELKDPSGRGGKAWKGQTALPTWWGTIEARECLDQTYTLGKFYCGVEDGLEGGKTRCREAS